ncbi:MAG: o-succinylbenzoate synthase [bacterium]
MLAIARITLREIVLPLKEAFQISSGTETQRRILLLQVEDADGRESWSECVAGSQPNYSPETIDTAWLAIREWVAPRLLGREFETPHTVSQILEQNFRGHNMAKAAVEMVTWELMAQIQEVSLARLLGGTRKKIATGISLGIQKDPEALIERVQQSLNAGYRKIKIKIKPGADVDYVRAVHQTFGTEAPLMVDANNAYRLSDLGLLQQLDDFGLMMIEQPLAWDDLVQHAKLQKQLKTPICLDESIISLAKARDMVELGSGKIVNIKPGRLGGFAASIAVHNFCAEHQIPVWCGGMLESGVGRAYNVALASLPNFSLPGDVSPSARYWERDIVTPEWTMDDHGMVAVPMDRVGMGVQVDVDRVENLTVRHQVLSRK